MFAELEEGHVPAPRVACDDGPFRIGDAALHQVTKTRVDVLELGAADIPDQSVAPFTAVTGGPPVIDEADGEAHVDERLDLRLPPVQVEPGRAAVDEHHHRERAAGVVWRDVETVDALPLGVDEVPGLVLASSGTRLPVERQDLRAADVDYASLPVALFVQQPHLIIRSHARVPDHAGFSRDDFQLSRCELEAQ